jgi:hypothetical protein
MIDVRMGKYQDIDAAAVTGALTVQFKSFLAFALEETAVKHYTAAVDVNDML